MKQILKKCLIAFAFLITLIFSVFMGCQDKEPIYLSAGKDGITERIDEPITQKLFLFEASNLGFIKERKDTTVLRIIPTGPTIKVSDYKDKFIIRLSNDSDKAYSAKIDEVIPEQVNISYNGDSSADETLEVSLYIKQDDGTPILQDKKVFKLKEKTKTAWEWIMGILNSALGATLGITALLTILWRSVLKIYNLGKSDKKLLVTKKEQKDFENEMRRDMRGYCEQIQKTVTDSVLRVVEKELKGISEIQDTATEMKMLKVNLESEIKTTMEKYDEIKSIGDTVRALSNKVTRLEYGQETSYERRSER